MGSTEGFTFAQDALISELKSKGWSVAAELISSSVVYLKMGMAAGYSTSNFLFNADSIQVAAFDVDEAVTASKAYLPKFQSAFEEFKANPASPQKLEQFNLSAKLFARLVGMEYSSFESFTKAYGESKLQDILVFFSVVKDDPEALLKSLKDLSDYHKTTLPGKLDIYSETSKVLL